MIKRGLDQSYPGMWSFFGGRFEKEDIDPKVTAKREFKEESGLDSLKYKISTKPVYVNQIGNLLFYNYLGLFEELFIPDLEKEGEAMDFSWFSLSDLPKNMHPGAIEFFEKNINLIKKIINE